MHAYIIRLLIAVSFLISFPSSAHFGSKGPYGGAVSTAIVADTNVFIASPSGGVFKSTNSRIVGWRPYPYGLTSGKVTSLAYVNGKVFAGTADSGVYYLNTASSDWKWQKASNGLSNTRIQALAAYGTNLFAGTDGGVFKSTDNGTTWTVVNTGLHHLSVTAFASYGNQLFLASDGGIFVSTNSGDSWAEFNDVNTEEKATRALTIVGSKILAAVEGDLFISDLASPSWSLATNGLGNEKVLSVTSNVDYVFASTNDGVFVSPINAISWSNISAQSSLENDTVTSLVVFRDKQIAGTKSNGIYVASWPIASWTKTNTGFNNLKTYALATLGEQVIVGATNRGVVVSKNLATSYAAANNGLTDSLNITDLVFSGTTLYVATSTKGVFTSADTGRSWKEMGSGLASIGTKRLFEGSGKIYAVSIDGGLYVNTPPSEQWTNPRVLLPSGLSISSFAAVGDSLFVGTGGNGIFYLAPDAYEWVQLQELREDRITSLTINRGRVYAGTWGQGVWSASLDEVIFQPIGQGLPSAYIQTLNAYAGYVFASFVGGVYATGDEGATWIPGGTQANLPSYANVYTIAFTTGTAARIFVTTPDNSFYSNAISELPKLPTGLFDNTIAKANVKVTIKPNPNSGAFTLSVNEKVENIEVLDFAGNAVQTLPSHSEQTARIEVPTGLYLIQVRTSKGISIQKIVIQ